MRHVSTEQVPGSDADSEGSSGGDGGSGNITVIAVVIVIIVIVIAAAVLFRVVMRSRNSDGAAGAGDSAATFTNPMYNNAAQASQAAYADIPAASGQSGTAYMDVSPTAPGSAQTSYMDVSPTANVSRAGASTSYMEVSVAPAGFAGSGNSAAGYMVG